MNKREKNILKDTYVGDMVRNAVIESMSEVISQSLNKPKKKKNKKKS
jgi:hypothetical protein